MKVKKPLLELLLERGLAEDENVARSLIMRGRVLVDGAKLDKAGFAVCESASITLLNPECPYVSRAGLKLKNCLLEIKGAAEAIAGQACLDVGSSTGGFTEVLLEYGAAKVYAVDVGKGLLDGRLRGDPRIVVMEGVNAHELAAGMVEPCGFFTVDVSFTSAAEMLRAIAPLISPEAQGLALIKPQFERANDIGDEKRGWFRKGVVRSPELRYKVLMRAWERVTGQGFQVLVMLEAKPAGAKGNREFFFHLAQGRVGMGEREAAELARELSGF